MMSRNHYNVISKTKVRKILKITKLFPSGISSSVGGQKLILSKGHCTKFKGYIGGKATPRKKKIRTR
jgi:hypothetical protein